MVYKSHMTDKAINSQRVKLKNAMAQACKSHESEQSQHDDLIRYNQAVIGMHQYYNMATNDKCRCSQTVPVD